MRRGARSCSWRVIDLRPRRRSADVGPEPIATCWSSPPPIARSPIATRRRSSGWPRRSRPAACDSSLVYPVPADQPAMIREHLEEVRVPLSAVRDTVQELVKHTGVTVTPEVAVIDAAAACVYRGRIDDRYVDFGKERPQPTTHDLEDALEAVVAGKPVAVRETRAVGCILVGPRSNDAAQREATAAVAVRRCIACASCTVSFARALRAQDVTFTSDIAPIVFDACVSCHRAGGPGPFQPRRPTTKSAGAPRRSRRSRAAASCRRGRSSRASATSSASDRSPTSEIALIDRWATSGTPEGDPQASAARCRSSPTAGCSASPI